MPSILWNPDGISSNILIIEININHSKNYRSCCWDQLINGGNIDQLKPLNVPNVSWGLRIFETKCESIAYYMWLLNYNHHYQQFREERLSQYISDIADTEVLAMTLAIYAEDIYYTQKIIRTLKKLEAYDRD